MDVNDIMSRIEKAKALMDKDKHKQEALDILRKYIGEATRSNANEYLYTDDYDIFGDDTHSMAEPVKKDISFTLAELQAIIDSLPQPGGYIHIDDLTKAITNAGDSK